MVKKKAVKQAKSHTCKSKDDEPEALFIPAGVLSGMGFGFLFGNLVAGLFIGLGAGFAVFAIISVLKSVGCCKNK